MTLIKQPDDTDVPVITSTRRWRVERRGAKEAQVFISPDGLEYVEAHPLERADLIRTFPKEPSFAPLRLVRWDGSSAARAEEKVQRLAAGRTRRQRARV